MKTIGIIAEYNPFHTGHEYQISYVRKSLDADYVVVAMSGDFVQRGAPAVFEKAVRTEMALRCGADLVLELPVSVSTASAEGFAQGAVSLLDGLGVVDGLCFGCEAGNSDHFLRLAQILVEEPPSYRDRLREMLKHGKSFPAARANSLSCLLRENPEYSALKDEVLRNALLQSTSTETDEQALLEFLSLPNNILALEYCKAILTQKSHIIPIALKRGGSGYHETALSSDRFPSATALREILYTMRNNPSKFPEGFVPDAIRPLFADALRRKRIVFAEDFNSMFVYRLLRETPESLSRYADISEALARRIFRHRFEFRDFEQFGELLKTKEITRTRIDRGLFHMLLDIRRTPAAIPYARVLGFRRESAALLSAIKRRGRNPLLTKPSFAERLLPPDSIPMLEETAFASNLYQSVFSVRSGQPFVHEFRRPLVIL